MLHGLHSQSGPCTRLDNSLRMWQKDVYTALARRERFLRVQVAVETLTRSSNCGTGSAWARENPPQDPASLDPSAPCCISHATLTAICWRCLEYRRELHACETPKSIRAMPTSLWFASSCPTVAMWNDLKGFARTVSRPWPTFVRPCFHHTR